MFRNFKIYDIIILVAALSSLFYSEVSWFVGDQERAIFVGLWVPSIIGAGIYIKQINSEK
jgi:hypothetical protein